MGPLGRTRAWLLDIDGTLVFTDHLYRQVFEKLLSPLGYDVTDTFYAANVHGKVDADVFGKLLPEGTSQEELLAWSKKKDDTFCDLYREECARTGPPLLNGLGEALGIAQQTGVRCIAVTNAQRGAGEAAIASLRELIPAASIIEGLVIGAECEQAKPHPAPYFEGMRQLGVVPDDCIVFEDSRCATGEERAASPTPCHFALHAHRPARPLQVGYSCWDCCGRAGRGRPALDADGRRAAQVRLLAHLA